MNLVNHAERINKLSSIFITHLDLLDDLDQIKVCTGYERKVDAEGGTTKEIGRLPATIDEYGQWNAVYETFEGWKQDTTKIQNFNDLPQ